MSGRLVHSDVFLHADLDGLSKRETHREIGSCYGDLTLQAREE